MEQPSPRRASSSAERTGPAVPGGAVGHPVAAHHDKAAGTGSHSAVISKTEMLVPAQLEAATVVGDDATAGIGGGHQEDGEGPLAHQMAGVSVVSGHANKRNVQAEAEAEAVTADVAAKLQIKEPVVTGFVPIKDVKGMLQTGRLEGRRIVYRSKKEKKDLLNGVIKGTSYFCLCGDCDQANKMLSAKAFEQHAVGNGHESHNPNDHILILSSGVSMYDATKKVKVATNGAMLEEKFRKILKESVPDEVSKKNATEVGIHRFEGDHSLIQRLYDVEKRVESIEKRMDRMEMIQSQLDTLEKNAEFLVSS